MVPLVLTLALSRAGAAAASAPRPPVLRTFEVKGSGRPLWRHWADLDGDGKLDLVVVTGSSSAAAAPDEGRIEDLIAYLQVTPFFLDKRQVLVFRQKADRFEPWGEPLPLTGDTSAVDVADLDGDGRPEILYAAGYSIYAFERGAGDAAYSPEARSLGTSEMLLGYTRSFIPGAKLAAEIVKGRPPSLALATPAGLEIRNLGPDGKLPAAPAFTLRNEFRSVSQQSGGTWLWDPQPRIVDMDADGTSDFLFQKNERVVIYRGRGDSTFQTPPTVVDLGGGGRGMRARRGRGRGAPSLEDIDGDGLLDCVRTSAFGDSDDEQGAEELADLAAEEGSDPENANKAEDRTGASGSSDAEPTNGDKRPREERGAKDAREAKDSNMREVDAEEPDAKEAKADEANRPEQAKRGKGGKSEKGAKDEKRSKETKDRKNRPVARAEIRLARRGPSFPAAADQTIEIKRIEKHEEATIEFLKIDADARADILVTRIAVSLWQIPRALISKKISIQVSFESMLQRPDGSFAPSRGKPFETKVTIDLKRGISGLPTSPQGDFNGDGITDLMEFTSAPEIKIHTTTPEGVFTKEPAWTAPLPREPEDRELMDVLDLDGDGRSDIAFFNLDGAGFVATILRSGQ